MISMNLTGKIAMVTGAGGGLGKSISIELAELGADLVLSCNSSRSVCDSLAAQITKIGRKAYVVQGDISQASDCARMVEEATQHYGKTIQILVNNAGFFYDVAPLIQMSDAQISKTIDINLKGTMYMSREVCRSMVNSGLPGRVVNITSGAAHSGRSNFSNYCASKAGVLGFTRALALELAPQHINVNSVSVGYVEVGRWQGDTQKDSVRANIIPRILLRKPGQPQDISRMVCFLVSECGDWITGSDFIIDGGESCGRVPFTDDQK
ncbi:SDR family NAD(P)-dependent oxidoreductase [Pyramidobacter porci]